MNNISKEDIAKYIKARREELGLKQDEMASTLGISPSTLSLYESGQRTPDLETLKNVAKELKVSFAEVIGVDVTKEQFNTSLRAQGLSKKEMDDVNAYIAFLKFQKESETK